MNKDFENYFLLNMNMLNIVKIDVEQLILQFMISRMRNFFKDEANIEFQELFDYELYLQNLFGEEFDILRESNDLDFQKKLVKWKKLKELNERGKSYTPYIEVKIKQRILGKEKLYFVSYTCKLNISRGFDNIPTSVNNQALIDTINLSMKEMAKMSIMKNDLMLHSFKSSSSINNTKNNNKTNDEETKELIKEDENDNKSAIDSLNMSMCTNNEKDLFKANSSKGSFNFFPKRQFIVLLIMTIAILLVVSLILTIVGLFFKINIYKTLKEIFFLEINSILMENNIYFISETMIVLGLIYNDILLNNKQYNLANESLYLLYHELNLFDQSSYNISYIASKYYSKDISEYLLISTTNIYQVFYNGYIYSRGSLILFDEITRFKKTATDYYNFFIVNKNELLSKTNDDNKNISNTVYNYFLLDTISSEETQKNISSTGFSLDLTNEEISLFYLLQNIFPEFVNYNNLLINKFYNILKKQQKSTIIKIGIYKLAELISLIITIIVEWLFIYLGFKKFRSKILSLRLKIEKNRIDISLQKIEEYKKFSNGLNIKSIYYIADMEYKIPNIIKKLNHISSEESPQIIDNIKMKTNNSISDSNTHMSSDKMDGKKNLWKMMQKLDQIKSGEMDNEKNDNKEENKDNEEVHNTQKSISMFGKNRIIEEQKNSIPEEKNSEEEKKNEEENQNGEDENNAPIKSVLRNSQQTSSSNLHLPKVENEENTKKNSNTEDEIGDDSKMKILKPEDQSLMLGLKKKNRTTKVQFKEKDIRYYTPGQGVNEVSHGFTEGINDSFTKDKNKMTPGYDFNQLTENTPNGINKIEELENLGLKKESEDKLPNFNISKSFKNISLSKEEIEKKIENMVRSNLVAKILLNSSLIIFAIVFTISFVFNYIYNNKFEKARNYTNYYFQKTSMTTEIILNYQLHVIKNIHDEALKDTNSQIKLSSLINSYKQNSEKLNNFINSNKIDNILKETSKLISITSGDDFCKNFGDLYIKYMKNDKYSSAEEVTEECQKIGDGININGYVEAESYTFTTLSIFIEDWKNIYAFSTEIDRKDIKDALNKDKFYNIVNEVIFTSSKFINVLTFCLFNDYEVIFKAINTLEEIFGIVSILLEIGFFVLSLLLIIYPIRSVDVIINWISKKYVS